MKVKVPAAKITGFIHSCHTLCKNGTKNKINICTTYYKFLNCFNSCSQSIYKQFFVCQTKNSLFLGVSEKKDVCLSCEKVVCYLSKNIILPLPHSNGSPQHLITKVNYKVETG